MVIVLSYIIAVIITMLLAVLLYPISALFYALGKIGYIMGWLSNFIFSHTNDGIKKLWADIRTTKVVRNTDYDESVTEPIEGLNL